MRHFFTVLTAALAVGGVAANSWFPGTKAVYSKWHETELERWLSDNNIPYPTPADRKELENLVDKNWNDHAVHPYKKWDTADLSAYLQAKGSEAAGGAEATKDSLLEQVRANWYETEENAHKAWAGVTDWILDTWTDSQLKAFADKHGIPVPQPRQRDTFLQKARAGYESAAKKIGETSQYPGNWLYETWTESDLKEWLDTHGFPVPQPSSRDKLIASVRRNSRLAYLKSQAQATSATASAQSAYATLTDMIIDAWSESQLKEFLDKNGVPVPQGTKANELRALVRKNRAEFLGENVAGKASSAFGAATSSAQNEYAKATDSASLAAQHAFDQVVGTWSSSRLKAYLDARGIPVPQSSNTDELRALVRKNSHKAASGWNAWTFDDFSLESLKNYLSKNGDAAAKQTSQKAGATRDELVSAAQSAFASASSAGGSNYASATSYLTQATETAKQSAFDTWTESEIKSFLDSYGIPVPQGSKIEELRALARRQATYFRYGTSTPSGTILAKIGEAAKNSWNWVAEQLHIGGEVAQKKASEAEAEAKKAAKEARDEL
jgi:3'-phosphoadenosine 5'-phosphosulfate sulfotransferase (PAPS reductase)/FAD synthetase